MRLSLRQKQDLYYELGQLIRSGIAFPAAVRTLQTESTGPVRTLLSRIEAATARGQTIAQAFARQRGAVTPMEASVVAACERSGRLDQGCRRLSEYFAALEQARATVVRKSLYPGFVFHFGVLMLGLPRLIQTGAGEYVTHTVGVLAFAYGVVGLIWLLCRQFARLAAVNILADRAWQTLPLLGTIHRNFSLARFCATHEMQLESGVNVFESLESAGAVSQSANVAAAVAAILPEVRAGSQIGPLLGRSGAFPPEMIRAFRVGEETGRLDEELRRLTEMFESKALRAVEAMSEWIPRALYALILVFLAREVIAAYQNVVAGYGRLLDTE